MIHNYLKKGHQHCDEDFVATENLVAESRWPEADNAFSQFVRGMERHFKQEEEIFFPAFEEATGMAAGPTQVMRAEHRDMRQAMADMEAALAARDRDDYLGRAETLLMLLQQHNLKEEHILYRMADQAMAGEAAALIDRMETVHSGEASHA